MSMVARCGTGCRGRAAASPWLVHRQYRTEARVPPPLQQSRHDVGCSPTTMPNPKDSMRSTRMMVLLVLQWVLVEAPLCAAGGSWWFHSPLASVRTVSRDGYTITVMDHGQPEAWNSAVLWVGLDVGVLREEAYEEAFIAVLLQPYLRADHTAAAAARAAAIEKWEAVGAVVAGVPEVERWVGLFKEAGDSAMPVADLLAYLNARIGWSITDRHLKKVFQAHHRTLGNLVTALGVAEKVVRLNKQAIEFLHLDALATSDVYRRIEAIDRLILDGRFKDGAMRRGYEQAKARVLEYLRRDFTRLEAALMGAAMNGAGWVVDGVQLIGEYGALLTKEMTDLGGFLGFSARSLRFLSLQSVGLSLEIGSGVYEDTRVLHTLCALATIELQLHEQATRLERDYFGILYTNTPDRVTSDPRWSEYLVVVEASYVAAHAYHQMLLGTFNTGFSLSPYEWLKAVVEAMKGLVADQAVEEFERAQEIEAEAWRARYLSIQPAFICNPVVPPADASASLSNPQFTPSTGDGVTRFRFAVAYRDPDGRDPSSAVLCLDGVEHLPAEVAGAVDKRVYSFSVAGLSSGSHTHAFVFRSSAGQELRLPVSGAFTGPEVTRSDIGAPRVYITRPSSGSQWTTGSGWVHMHGMAEGSPMEVVWVNQASGERGTATGTTNWSTGSIHLNVGLNPIVVTATDSAARSGVARLEVIYSKNLLQFSTNMSAAAFVLAGTPSRGYTDGIMSVGYSAEPMEGASRTYLQPASLAGIPAGSQIETAVLEVVTESSRPLDAPAMTMHIMRVEEPWHAGAVSWSNQPRAAERLRSARVPGGRGQVVSWDVSDHIREVFGGRRKDFGVALVSDAEQGPLNNERALFGIANRRDPKLKVTYQPEANPPVLRLSGSAAATVIRTEVSSVTISGTATDDSGGVGVAWAAFPSGESGEIADGAAWSVSIRGLQPGTNRVDFVATDRAGNRAGASVLVEYRPPGLECDMAGFVIRIPEGSPVQERAMLIRNSGYGRLQFEARTGASWVALRGATGSVGSDWHQVKVGLGGPDLRPGTYRTAIDVVDVRGLAAALSLPVVVTVTAHEANGSVLFANRMAPAMDAPVLAPDGRTRLSGSGYRAQLYAGDSQSTMRPVGAAVAFRDGAGAGYVRATSCIVPGVPPGSLAMVQMRAWDALGGDSFEQAQAADAAHGAGPVVGVLLGGGMVPPPAILGLQSFSLKPSRVALRIAVEGCGSVMYSPVADRLEVGTSVTVSAIPEQGCEFESWLGDFAGEGATVQTVASSGLAATAVFRPFAGTVNFANTVPGQVNAPIVLPDGVTAPAGPAFRAQLYAGLGPTQLVPVGSPVPLGERDRAGFFDGGTRVVPWAKAGSSIFMQVRVWEVAGQRGFESALRGGALVGGSPVLLVELGGDAESSSPAVLRSLAGFMLEPGMLPRVTLVRTNWTVMPGTSVELHGLAQGFEPLEYQWRKDGMILQQAITSGLRVALTSPADAGYYEISVRDLFGFGASAGATVSILPPFRIGISRRGEGDLVLTCLGLGKGEYALEFSSELEVWHVVGSISGSAGESQVIVIGGSGSSGFYRLAHVRD